MDVKNGLSQLTVTMPDGWPDTWDHSEFHNIVIDNKIGRATIQFQTEE
jgi:hypothetical protein